ncbi:MAG: hypothetical protein L6Q72_02265 [Burkholderiaceae bacterium]|nr:hypothetical protein [Burkholderiaceae bacterium]
MAAALGIEAELRVGGIEPGDFVGVRLIAAQALPPEAALRVRLVHPGRSRADRSAVLARVGTADAGRSVEYVGSWGEAAPVAQQPAWRVVVETAQWRIDGDAMMENGRLARVFRLAAKH